MSVVSPSYRDLETILIKLNENIEEPNEDSDHNSSVDIDENVDAEPPKLSARGRESTLENLSLLFSQKSEELIGDLILHPEHRKTYRQLGKRLRNLDEDLFKQFQSSLSSIQRISELLRKGNAEELDSFTAHITKLPFLETIISTFCNLHLPADNNKVYAITNLDVRIRVIAQLINRDGIPLGVLNLQKKDLMLLAPHLTFVNCQGAFNDWDEKEIKTFFNACQKINSEMHIHALAQLINQRKIHICTFPLSKQELMLLAPHIKILHCQDVLKDWPIRDIEIFLNACQNIELLTLNDKRITHLPPLPCCKYLNCSGCCCLESLPELPECLTLICESCTCLKSLPELPRCTSINCLYGRNLDLNTFPPALINRGSLSLDINTVLAIKDPNVRLLFITKCINDSYPSSGSVDCPVPLVNFTRQELMLIAPNIKNLNCKGAFNGWTIEAIEEFLNACPNIVLLWIDSPEIRRLPQRNYENLDCSGCYALESLPELPRCRKLICSNCFTLRQLPSLPVCDTVDIANCCNIEKVSPRENNPHRVIQGLDLDKLDFDKIPDKFLTVVRDAAKAGRFGRFEDLIQVRRAQISYLMRAMEKYGNNSRQVKLLKEAGADYHFAEKAMDIKFLGLAWGLAGNFSLIDGKGRNVSISLEGCEEAYTGEQLYFYVNKFFKLQEFNSDNPLISKEIQGIIQESIANCFPLTLDSNAEKVKKIKSGKPFVFFTGWTTTELTYGREDGGHVVSVVIAKDRLIVFNRGSHRGNSAATVYLLPKEDVTENMIHKFEKCYNSQVDFFAMVRGLNLQHRVNEDFNHKDQEVGNCSWAGIKGAFAVLCRLLTNPVLGHEVYKHFSHFVRKETLRSYIEKFDKNVDPKIIEKVKKKCLEKTTTSKSFSKDFVELGSQLDQLSKNLKGAEL